MDSKQKPATKTIPHESTAKKGYVPKPQPEVIRGYQPSATGNPSAGTTPPGGLGALTPISKPDSGKPATSNADSKGSDS